MPNDRIMNRNTTSFASLLDLPVARPNTRATVNALAIWHVVSWASNLSADWEFGVVVAAAVMVGVGPSVTLHSTVSSVKNLK